MEKPKLFTPAPWFRVNKKCDVKAFEHIFVICEAGYEYVYSDSYVYNHEANANLIATTPELYNILERMAEADFELTESMCLEARRVLAKARGKND